MNKRGSVTIPTDSDLVEKTKFYLDYWGADAIRDCDGVKLPKDLKQFNCDVYKAYFIVREDHEYALKHKEYLQNVAIITDRHVALSNTLTIDLLENLFRKSLEVNLENYKKYWQVFDRTTNKIHDDWEYLGDNIVKINNAIKFHEYTVSFFARNTWDPVQIYNYHSNNWKDVPIDLDLDPIYPEALAHMLERMEKWCQENPDITVVRFTTFFYNFLILYKEGTVQTYWDWHNYAMSASPKMFEYLKETYNFDMTLEDIVTGGTYASKFQIPSKTTRQYIDYIQLMCANWAKQFVDIVHKYNKKAMMFDGDHRIGVEPYSKYFSSIGLDAVVGAPHSGPYIRLLTDMSVPIKEGRLNPYFFPNECPSDEIGFKMLTYNWNSEKRGLLKKCIDRIGFGGYLRIADSYPKFSRLIKDVCDEFRTIKDNVGKNGAYSHIKIAVMSYWGKLYSWMMNGTFTDDVTLETEGYGALINAICGLPVDVSFISFDDIIENDILKDYDVIINTGLAGSSFQGDYYWKNEALLRKIREYVYNGGGYLGIGDPSGYLHAGQYFQLSDILGVQKEVGFSYAKKKLYPLLTTSHWITSDLDMNKVKFGKQGLSVYPINATVLASAWTTTDSYERVQAAGHVNLSVNDYGKGRAVFISSLEDSSEAYRLIYKALLYVSHHENKYLSCLSSNANTDCYYYEANNKYAILNNTDDELETDFYDINGHKEALKLKPHEIIWIQK